MNIGDDDELALTEDMQVAGEDGGDDDDHGSLEQGEASVADEFSLELEGEEEVEETPLIRDMRQQLADAKRELAEHRKVNAPKIEVGKKPDLWEDCDGDPEKFETELVAWQDRKRQAETQEQSAVDQQEVRNREFARQVTTYKTKLAALPLPEDQKAAAEKTVIAALPELLQSALVSYTDDPAKVVVALAKYPNKLAEIARETDPIKAIIAMRELEKKLMVTRKPPPEPEAGTIQRGSAPIAKASADKKAEALLQKAIRTGNMDEYRAYTKGKKAA